MGGLQQMKTAGHARMAQGRGETFRLVGWNKVIVPAVDQEHRRADPRNPPRRRGGDRQVGPAGRRSSQKQGHRPPRRRSRTLQGQQIGRAVQIHDRLDARGRIVAARPQHGGQMATRRGPQRRDPAGVDIEHAGVPADPAHRGPNVIQIPRPPGSARTGQPIIHGDHDQTVPGQPGHVTPERVLAATPPTTAVQGENGRPPTRRRGSDRPVHIQRQPPAGDFTVCPIPLDCARLPAPPATASRPAPVVRSRPQPESRKRLGPQQPLSISVVRTTSQTCVEARPEVWNPRCLLDRRTVRTGQQEPARAADARAGRHATVVTDDALAQSRGFQIPDSRFQIPDSRFQIANRLPNL